MRKLIPYLYLLRVPILLGLALAAFPLLAVFTDAFGVLFENLFDLSAFETLFTAFVAVITSWSLLLTARLVLLNGADRFGTAQISYAASLSSGSAIWAIALALPAMFAQFARNADFRHEGADIRVRLLAIAGGIAVAYVVAYIGLFLAVLLAPEGTQISVLTFPAPRPFLRALAWADRLNPLGAFWSKLGPRLRKLPEFLRVGYLDPVTGFPLSGHWQAFIFGGVTFTLYVFIDILKRTVLSESKLPFPALFFVIWLILNTNWLVAFMAFLLDRYRIPLILPFAAIAWIAAQSPANDHYFSVSKSGPAPTISPSVVLSNRQSQGKKLVLVASDGGGIQAAAWTARVLTGLQLDSLGLSGGDGSRPWPQDFAGSVALVSAVSGGAAGAMFFLNEYQPTFTAPPEKLQKIVDDASGPSLDDIAWALVYHDISRIYWPFGRNRLLDRGLMLEQSWQRRANIQAKLSQWREGVLEGLRPAMIFNSTVAETGVPLLFSTSDIPDVHEPRKRGFEQEYPGFDVPVVTAARMAATFPYVSPAARADTGKMEYHLVDGGYYDNYGVSSLVAWLFEAVKDKSPTPEVLVIQIVSFPTAIAPVAKSGSAVFQIYAPLAALFGVRSSSQLIRDTDDLTRLTNRWPSIKVTRFQFQGASPPLSWQMNAREKNEIERAWTNSLSNAGANHADLKDVRCFFGVECENRP